MTPALVLFDMDGTLVDSQATIVAAMSTAFTAVDRRPPSRLDVLGVVGMSLPQAIRRLAPDIPEQTQAALVDAYKTAYRAGLSGAAPSAPYDGALETVRKLSAHPEILLGVATGKSRRGLDRALAEMSISRHFLTTQSADEHPSKPHPSMIEAALSETGVRRDRAVMVGDTTFDIDMARAAGIRAIGVTWGYHAEEALREAGASELVDDFAALETAIGRFLRAAA